MKQETRPSKMPRCQAFKTDQTPCTKNATRNGGEDTHPAHIHLCSVHKRVYGQDFHAVGDTHHIEGRCFHTARVVVPHAPNQHRHHLLTELRWCPSQAAEGATLCDGHEGIRQQFLQRQRQREEDRGIVTGLVDGLVRENPPIPWQRAVRILLAAPDIHLALRRAAAEAYYRLPRTRQLEPDAEIGGLWRLRNYWNWALGGGVDGPEPLANPVPVQPPPPPATGLRAIARDNQNVHTGAVSQQTNAATEKLLAVKVSETQQTEKTMAVNWLGTLGVSYSTFLRVATDINRWFNTKDCRAPGDNLYRRLLRGLVALLASEKDDERKTEMFRRLWEECCEAIGMCCEGHISRLCNVLVGFDEAFQPPVPFGEILQSKMAAIAGLDVSEEEKRKQANAFFDEHKVPQADRVAWLDAF